MIEQILIYGVGKCGKRYIDSCVAQSIESLELTDANESLWGTEYKGIKIYNPDEIEWKKYSLIIIAVGDNYKEEVIYQLLKKYKLQREKILFHNETIILSKKEIYNWGDIEFSEEIDRGLVVPLKIVNEKINLDKVNDLEKFFFFKKHQPISKWVHYFEAYDRFFSKYRGKDITVLEIGVYKGGSLQMWKNYFTMNGNMVKIYGIDINPDCKKLERKDVSIFIGSQEDREFLKKIKDQIGSVDILIDDGGHTMNQQIISFEELFPIVSEEGIYLCEDLHTSYMENYEGKYKGDTFIEYSKNLIDYLHAQYLETGELKKNIYSETIKAISYWDSMIFIEKKKLTTKSISMEL